MIYNDGHKFTKLIESCSQEDIYNCPEYFAMSRDEIVKSGCPSYLKRILDDFTWADRPNVIQVRPQDFRTQKPMLLGDGWHIDVNVRLKDGKVRTTDSMNDFRLLVVSFGDVVQTEFIKTHLELPDLFESNAPGHGEFFSKVNQMHFEIEQAGPNQLAEYTSRDIHRMGNNYKLGRFRLMIVAFESSIVTGDGWVLPSIKDKEHGCESPKFEDYIT